MSKFPHTSYTLNEYGVDGLESTSLDVNGGVMVFDSFTAAAEMAAWMLEGNADEIKDYPAKTNRLPLVSILCSEHTTKDLAADWENERHDGPELSTGYAAGWVVNLGGKVTVHEGDYENDNALWDAMTPLIVR